MVEALNESTCVNFWNVDALILKLLINRTTLLLVMTEMALIVATAFSQRFCLDTLILVFYIEI